jgi:hypothetical protein
MKKWELTWLRDMESVRSLQSQGLRMEIGTARKNHPVPAVDMREHRYYSSP